MTSEFGLIERVANALVSELEIQGFRNAITDTQSLDQTYVSRILSSMNVFYAKHAEIIALVSSKVLTS